MVLDVMQIPPLAALGRDDREQRCRDDRGGYFSDSALMTACAAARRAIGTRNGEHET